VSGNHIQGVVRAINEAAHAAPRPLVLAGENIDSGSRIAGMARGLEPKDVDRIMNVGNCELAHCGIGFGMMLDGSHFTLFMKQLDFLLLGLDQLVNTYQFIRAHVDGASLGGFTIYVIVCDQGYQGSQSSLNALGDVASLTRIPVFCLNAVADVDRVVADEFFADGVRIVAVSQRQFGLDPHAPDLLDASADRGVFQYGRGGDVTLVASNFALRQASSVADRLRSQGVGVDLFHHNFVPGADRTLVLESAGRTGRILVLDDSKSHLSMADDLVSDLRGGVDGLQSRVMTRRDLAPADFGVVADEFEVEDAAVDWVVGATG